MTIKGKLEWTDKLRVWDENIHTNIHQVDNKKGPTERTEDSTEQTAITYMRQKKNRQTSMYN